MCFRTWVGLPGKVLGFGEYNGRGKSKKRNAGILHCVQDDDENKDEGKSHGKCKCYMEILHPALRKSAKDGAPGPLMVEGKKG